MRAVSSVALIVAMSAGCTNTWQIGVIGHVFNEVGGELELTTATDVDLCWEVETQIDPAAFQQDALTGCDSGVTTRDGVVRRRIEGLDGKAVTDVRVTADVGGETVEGYIVSREIFEVSCSSSYV